MNKSAERHLAFAKDYLAQGDQYYRQAKAEIDAAHAEGASVQEIAKGLGRSDQWVRDTLYWDGKGTLYGKDTEARGVRMTKQVLREAPLEQIEQMISDLPKDRQAAIGAAAKDKYMTARHEYNETEKHMTPAQHKEREAAIATTGQQVGRMMIGFNMLGVCSDIGHAVEILKEINKEQIEIPTDQWRELDHILSEFVTELNVARMVAGLEVADGLV